MIFKRPYRVHFDEADPAGIAFSGTVFTKVHRIYEEFIADLGQDPQKFFLNPEVIFPLRHMEAEYLGPLFPLHDYQVGVQVLKISDSSFTLQFNIGEPETEKALCQVRSTHVCCLKKGMKKASIPDDLKQNLEKFVIPQ